MSLVIFGEKVKAHLKAAGYTQKALALALNWNASVLAHKLNGTGRTTLNHPEIKELVKVLASLEAISSRKEALDLLEEMGCPGFSQAEWTTKPLNKLEIDSPVDYRTAKISKISNNPDIVKVEAPRGLADIKSPQTQARTVTFLFTSLESSPALWDQHPAALKEALNSYAVLLEDLLTKKGGQIFKTVGATFQVAFPTTLQALEAALAAQLVLAEGKWKKAPALPELKVRMAIHTGSAEFWNGSYFGSVLSWTERLLETGHGGQILLSLVSAELVRDQLPHGASLLDLGEYQLKDAERPEHIFQVVAPGLPFEFPHLNSPQVLPTNLPVQLTSFIGRKEEIAHIRSLLELNRLVTLTGPGGSGKTRLAIQVGVGLVQDYKNGVWLVELTAVSDPDLVAQAVATTLNIREEPGKPLLDTLVGRLHSRRLLLILDNCEHLIDNCARLVERLVKFCPFLTLLATSREALMIGGERAFLVPSLETPAFVEQGHDLKDGEGPEEPPPALSSKLKEFEAVQLFIQRAAAVKPGFEITSQNATMIAKICSELDGMPLAIELAAARVRMMSVEQIYEHLSDRFRLLSSGNRAAQPRQRTLRASIEWSYDLLEEAERKVFYRSSAFAGRWSLEAAEVVCAGPEIHPENIYDIIFQLVNKSLLVSLSEESVGTRFNMLETLRQYALERLEESGHKELIISSHGYYYLNLLEEIQPLEQMEENVREAWLKMVRTDLDNLRLALSRATEANQFELAYRLTKGLTPYWDWEGYINEAINFTQAVLEKIAGVIKVAQKTPVLGKIDLNQDQNREQAKKDNWPEKLALLRENLANWLMLTGHYEEAQELYSLALSTISNSKTAAVWEARLIRKLARTWHNRRDYERALSLYAQAEDRLDLNSDGPDPGRGQEWINIQLQKLGVFYERNNQSGTEELLPQLRRMLDKYGTPKQREVDFPTAMLSYLYRQNRYDITEEHLGYARILLKRTKQADKIIEAAAAQFRLGFSLLWHLDFDEAEQQFLECLILAKKIEDVTLQARCLAYLSIGCRRKGLLDQTRHYLEQLAALLNKVRMDEYQGVHDANQGWLYWKHGKPEEAQAYLERALAYWPITEAKSTPVYPFRWLALWPLIDIMLVKKNMEQALEYSWQLSGFDQQPLPEELKHLLKESWQDQDLGKREATSRRLRQAVELARAKRYL